MAFQHIVKTTVVLFELGVDPIQLGVEALVEATVVAFQPLVDPLELVVEALDAVVEVVQRLLDAAMRSGTPYSNMSGSLNL